MKFDSSNTVEANKARVRFEYLIQNNKKFELNEVRKKRSISQNSYLHVAITLYAIYFGLTINEAKTDLKRECHFMTYEKNGKKYLVETSKQDSKELSYFVDWIRNYASKEGCYIPDANEYLLNKYNIDKEIGSNKEHL